MSNSTTHELDEKQVEKYSKIFKALSNPSRLKIVLELINCSVCESRISTPIRIDQVENCQQEFARHLGLAPSTISHHFKELRQAGLLKTRREGKNLIVNVNTDLIDTLKTLF